MFKLYKTGPVLRARLASMTLGLLLGLGSLTAQLGVLGTAALAFSPDAGAVTCGSYDGKLCHGTAFQYAGGFAPNVGESGGFGGASSCVRTHTPVVFVHGNTDNSTSWDAPPTAVPGYTAPPRSVYQEFKAAGYQDCELFGVTYLTSSEQGSAQYNYHKESKYQIIQNFIKAVKTYTGASQVDVVTHSFGVSMTMATLTYYGSWGNVRRFVNIAGGLHGLDTCIYTGYANSAVPTCGSQNIYDSWIFGFYPDSAYPGINPWTGTSASYALSNSAAAHTAVSFYTIYAGTKDQIMCSTYSDYANCGASPLLKTTAGNVRAQLNVGAGSDTTQVNWNWYNGMPFNNNGGDTNGVGHLHSRDNTGRIVVNMLTTTCTGTACAAGYTYGPVH